MKFLKENSYDIVRLYINQIGIAIFSLVLYFSVGMIENDGLLSNIKLFISIFAMLFYFSLLYTAAWDMGAKDKIKVDSGKLSENRFKGLFMALLANIPNFILAGVCAATMGVNLINGSVAMKSLSFAVGMIMRMTCSMYLGLMQGIFVSFEHNPELYNFLQSCGFFVAPLLAVFATQIGYYFGLRNIRIFSSSKSKNSSNKNL